VATIENRIQASLTAVHDKAKQEGEEGMRLKVVEREQQIASMQRQIEDLKRKAEQWSQKLQGEAQEVELEAILSARFPQDIIEAVPKGEFGDDLLHRVIGPVGQYRGTILWESKRTKNWSEAWLSKPRGDQRAAKAGAALIISNALPKGLTTFDLIDGVWVAGPRCAIPIAVALRHALIELRSVRQTSEGQQTKMEQVYRYLTGAFEVVSDVAGGNLKVSQIIGEELWQAPQRLISAAEAFATEEAGASPAAGTKRRSAQHLRPSSRGTVRDGRKKDEFGAAGWRKRVLIRPRLRLRRAFQMAAGSRQSDEF
jgi:hypothetical protein